jgi:hypothetical protein
VDSVSQWTLNTDTGGCKFIVDVVTSVYKRKNRKIKLKQMRAE